MIFMSSFFLSTISNSILHHVSVVNVHPLQNVLVSMAQIIPHERKFDCVIAGFQDQLQWLHIQQTVEYKVCVLV